MQARTADLWLRGQLVAGAFWSMINRRAGTRLASLATLRLSRGQRILKDAAAAEALPATQWRRPRQEWETDTDLSRVHTRNTPPDKIDNEGPLFNPGGLETTFLTHEVF